MKSILLVEDDTSLGETLVQRLAEEPYDVAWARSLSEARTTFHQKQPDLILLDIGLPDGSGFTFAREVRGEVKTPIIFLTAMNSAEYRLEGFEIGADDYIPKPFHLKELLLRIHKVLEGRAVSFIRKAGDFKLSEEGYTVYLPDGKYAEFSVRDFDLLKFLIDESPRAVSRTEILERVFKTDATITPRIVDNSIVRIRTALGTQAEGHLRAVRSVGYQWIS